MSGEIAQIRLGFVSLQVDGTRVRGGFCVCGEAFVWVLEAFVWGEGFLQEKASAKALASLDSFLTLGFLLRARPLKSLVGDLCELGGCFVVDRYVFGLSTKHPIMSAHEYIQGKLFSPCPRVEKMAFLSTVFA